MAFRLYFTIYYSFITSILNPIFYQTNPVISLSKSVYFFSYFFSYFFPIYKQSIKIKFFFPLYKSHFNKTIAISSIWKSLNSHSKRISENVLYSKLNNKLVKRHAPTFMWKIYFLASRSKLIMTSVVRFKTIILLTTEFLISNVILFKLYVWLGF